MPGTGPDAGHLSINTIDKNLIVYVFRASALAGADTNSITQIMTGGRGTQKCQRRARGTGILTEEGGGGLDEGQPW